MIALAIIIGLFIVLGFIFSSGKGSFLIAGLNTMSKKKKATYDSVALCKFMGKAMFGLSFSMVFWLLSDLFNNSLLFIIGLLLFIGIVIFILIYANTGDRFKK